MRVAPLPWQKSRNLLFRPRIPHRIEKQKTTTKKKCFSYSFSSLLCFNIFSFIMCFFFILAPPFFKYIFIYCLFLLSLFYFKIFSCFPYSCSLLFALIYFHILCFFLSLLSLFALIYFHILHFIHYHCSPSLRLNIFLYII